MQYFILAICNFIKWFILFKFSDINPKTYRGGKGEVPPRPVKGGVANFAHPPPNLFLYTPMDNLILKTSIGMVCSSVHIITTSLYQKSYIYILIYI